MLEYKRLGPGVILLRDAVNVGYVPPNAELPEWQAFERHVAGGGLVLPEDPPPTPTKDAIDEDAARQFVRLTNLSKLSPAEIEAWMLANVTNLAQARDALTTLAIAFSVLWRRVLRERQGG